LERELGLKASLVEALRRDLEEEGAELRAEWLCYDIPSQ
jgi:hypothetical protein